MAKPGARQNTIIVTGGAGYIGSAVVRKLLHDGYRVLCIDKLDFGEASLADIHDHPNFVLERVDLNDHARVDEVLDAEKHRSRAVVHLAAIVGDPACAVAPELARKTNLEASLHLLESTVAAGISRLVFASTCSNYGKMADSTDYVDETSPLVPLSLYAELKVAFEKAILEKTARPDGFSPTCLRFATAYGISPRMRFDLTVNDFTKELALGRVLSIYGEQFWRPYCHIGDFAVAIATVLGSPKHKVAYNAFNVGDTDQNYTKKMLSDELLQQIPGAKIRFVHKDEDPRDYRVRFDKIRDVLGFRISNKVPVGIRDILRGIRSGDFGDPDDPRYYNIKPQ